jgi:hypothetical protein
LRPSAAGSAQPPIGQTPSAADALVHAQDLLDKLQQGLAIYAEDCPNGCLSVNEAAHLVATWVYMDVWTIDSLTSSELATYSIEAPDERQTSKPSSDSHANGTRSPDQRR